MGGPPAIGPDVGRVTRLLATALLVVAMVAAALAVAGWGMRTVEPPGAPEARAPALAAGSAGVPSGDGWAAWGARQDGTPLRWDPCRTIEWVVRPGDPDWLVELAGRALDRVGDEAGIEFRHAGRRDVGIGETQRTADRASWQPVVVTLTSPDEVEWLTDDDRALAVPVVVNDVFVTGQVLLDADADLATDFGSRDHSWGATLLHEAAHLAGLDHVDDPDQLLYPYPRPGAATLGDGDLRGLHALADDGQCLDPGPVADLAVDTPTRR